MNNNQSQNQVSNISSKKFISFNEYLKLEPVEKAKYYLHSKYLEDAHSEGYYYHKGYLSKTKDDVIVLHYKKLGLAIYYATGSVKELLGYKYNNEEFLAESEGRGVSKFLNWLEINKPMAVSFNTIRISYKKMSNDLHTLKIKLGFDKPYIKID